MHQRDLDAKPGLHRPLHVCLEVQKRLHHPQHVFLGEGGGEFGVAGAVLFGNIELGGAAPDQGEEQMAQQFDQPVDEFLDVGTGIEGAGDDIQYALGRSRGDGSDQFEIEDAIDQAQHLLRRLLRHLTAEGGHLVEQALGIAQRPVGAAGQKVQGHRFGGDALGLGDSGEMGGDLPGRDATEVEALAAREDGLGDRLHLGGGKDKDYVLGRLFQSLQQGVEGRRREHVHLVDDVNLIGAFGRGIAHDLAQLADVIDAIVGGAIYLQHIHAGGGGNALAGVADLTGVSALAVGTV